MQSESRCHSDWSLEASVILALLVPVICKAYCIYSEVSLNYTLRSFVADGNAPVGTNLARKVGGQVVTPDRLEATQELYTGRCLSLP